jgi:antitoxin HicB
MMRYPLTLSPDGEDILVTFIGLPASTFGSDEADALLHAVDALETLFMGAIANRKPIPDPPVVPKKFKGKWVTVPALSEAKIELYKAMLAEKIGKAELARRLNAHLPQLDRLLDLSHASRLDQVEQALLAVGKRLTVEFEDVQGCAGGG